MTGKAMEKVVELKSCPFCSGDASFERSFSGGPYVLCGGCGAAAMFAKSTLDAADLWNTRAALTPPDGDEVERLEMRVALDDLQQAEAEYRLMHDRHGDGSRAAGRAWDLMRRAGDRARKALGKSS